VLAAGARRLAAAAGALRGVRGQLGAAVSFVVVAGAWRGPASTAFLVDDEAMQLGLERAAGALGEAAAAVAELAARLDHAQATWDEGQRLAASAGLTLDQDGVVSPATGALSASPAAAGLAARLAATAVHEATAARAAAAARLDQAATPGPVPSPREGARGDGGAGHGWGRRLAVEALETGREVATGTYHLLGGADARLHAAGRVATASDDGTAKLWDAVTSREVLTVFGHDRIVHTAAFSHDGRFLATASADGTVALHLLPIDELRKLAITRVTRALTDQECRQYLHLDACRPK